jgi:hypothetical protein
MPYRTGLFPILLQSCTVLRQALVQQLFSYTVLIGVFVADREAEAALFYASGAALHLVMLAQVCDSQQLAHLKAPGTPCGTKGNPVEPKETLKRT